MGCYYRVSSTQGCSGLPPAVPSSHHPNGGSPELLPEEENHNLNAGAGWAPLERGRQPSSLLAGPCRRLAAAPADLRGSRPCPRCSLSTRCPHSHPGATGKRSAFPPSFLWPSNSPLLFKLGGFCSGMASSICCVCAELLCPLQLLTHLAPAEGLNKVPKYSFWGIFGPLLWGTRCFGRTRDFKSISLMFLGGFVFCTSKDLKGII